MNHIGTVECDLVMPNDVLNHIDLFEYYNILRITKMTKNSWCQGGNMSSTSSEPGWTRYEIEVHAEFRYRSTGTVETHTITVSDNWESFEFFDNLFNKTLRLQKLKRVINEK